ncbi:uncharacterized protein LOC116418595 [Piliocolobus tephrosceles]|uniref:uncharacterized protein LOC116418595 n=1 Tax=Piliocolobus tephrosceles TaxID=591936 RepID=UPI00130197F9|nr:uncharacterized protein LOC116418595 [Piliocolobus tephrosceles]XP_031790832.1 uncharacterized protein LOC116418595 [Piliocolobus tephrosceles]
MQPRPLRRPRQLERRQSCRLRPPLRVSGSHRRCGRRTSRAAEGRGGNTGEGEERSRARTESGEGRTDARAGAATEPARLLGSAPGGGGSGVADEGRGKLYGDNSPAARLWGRPRLAERPGSVLAPAGRVPLPSGVRGAPVARARGSRRPSLPLRLPGVRRAAFPGSPGRSWILLPAKAGSEFRTAIPASVTSEKFFFFFRRRSYLALGNSCKTRDQEASPHRNPHQRHLLFSGGQSTSALTRERSSAGSKVTNEGKEIMSSQALKKLP